MLTIQQFDILNLFFKVHLLQITVYFIEKRRYHYRLYKSIQYYKFYLFFK